MPKVNILRYFLFILLISLFLLRTYLKRVKRGCTAELADF